jgi:hypothetical protein
MSRFDLDVVLPGPRSPGRSGRKRTTFRRLHPLCLLLLVCVVHFPLCRFAVIEPSGEAPKEPTPYEHGGDNTKNDDTSDH